MGTLAGGIAHDFNNLLGGVLAHSELAHGGACQWVKPPEELQEIRLAAIRGSEIVRQLMIYAGEEASPSNSSAFRGSWKTCSSCSKCPCRNMWYVETDLSQSFRRCEPTLLRFGKW